MGYAANLFQSVIGHHAREIETLKRCEIRQICQTRVRVMSSKWRLSETNPVNDRLHFRRPTVIYVRSGGDHSSRSASEGLQMFEAGTLHKRSREPKCTELVQYAKFRKTGIGNGGVAKSELLQADVKRSRRMIARDRRFGLRPRSSLYETLQDLRGLQAAYR